MTKEQFEREYAERSGTTVEKLHSHGWYAEPCSTCDDPDCTGWKMTWPDSREAEREMAEFFGWWKCERCGFTGPHVGSGPNGARLCIGSCGGTELNPKVLRP